MTVSSLSTSRVVLLVVSVMGLLLWWSGAGMPRPWRGRWKRSTPKNRTLALPAPWGRGPLRLDRERDRARLHGAARVPTTGGTPASTPEPHQPTGELAAGRENSGDVGSWS